MEGYREQETYKIIGICMEVHRILGPGLLEIVYKDALEMEFKLNNILYQREKEFSIDYKGEILRSKFNADFTVCEDIVFRSKSSKRIL
ncbi:GxxExxY protein [Flavobacterium sp. XS2P12]|uniref:GxxExxY protein n=1 Tax=Flavobacterium melibiosi TaxID=3398734 RepID=UPI003A85CDB4